MYQPSEARQDKPHSAARGAEAALELKRGEAQRASAETLAAAHKERAAGQTTREAKQSEYSRMRAKAEGMRERARQRRKSRESG